MGTCFFRLVMSISSLRSSLKLARPEGSGATFLMTGSSLGVPTKKLDGVCTFGASLNRVACSVVLFRVHWWSFLLATSALSHSLARIYCFFCSTRCFPQLGSLNIVNSRALNSLPGNCIHSCLDISWEGATGRWTSHSFFHCLILLPYSFANHSFLDSSSYALVNLCGCWHFWGYRSKCTSQRLHLMEGLWYFN